MHRASHHVMLLLALLPLQALFPLEICAGRLRQWSITLTEIYLHFRAVWQRAVSFTQS